MAQSVLPQFETHGLLGHRLHPEAQLHSKLDRPRTTRKLLGFRLLLHPEFLHGSFAELLAKSKCKIKSTNCRLTLWHLISRWLMGVSWMFQWSLKTGVTPTGFTWRVAGGTVKSTVWTNKSPKCFTTKLPQSTSSPWRRNSSKAKNCTDTLVPFTKQVKGEAPSAPMDTQLISYFTSISICNQHTNKITGLKGELPCWLKLTTDIISY